MSSASKIKSRNAALKHKEINKIYAVESINVITAILLVTLKQCYGFGDKRLSVVMESIHSLIDEQNTKHSSPQDIIDWCKELTGIDAREVWND